MNSIRERNWRQARSRTASFWARNQRTGALGLNRAPLDTESRLGQTSTVAYTATPSRLQGIATPRRDRNEEE